MANRNKKTADKYEQSKNTESRDDYSMSKDNRRGNKSKGSNKGQGCRKNDLSWYCTDEQILKDVARIPYSIPVGYPMSRRGKINIGLTASEFDNAIPGIASMSIIPTIGNAQHANDAVNVAANGMYTFVRHWNSGSRNYDANDLIIYCMAVDSVYYMLSWATRLYATLSLYAQGNRYLPDALIRAQHVDPNDLRANMAQFRAGINQRIRKIATLVVPSVLPIFSRHSWLFSNYFIEGESVKDQIYLFTPDAWYKFGYDNDSAGMLTCYKLRGTHTVGGETNYIGCDDILTIVDQMIDPIFADEDFNIVSGDILKAYGETNILKLALIPDELPIGVAFSEEVLLQFKNAKTQNVMTDNNHDDNPVLSRNFWNGMFNIHQSSGKSYVIVERDPTAISYYHDFDFSQGYFGGHTDQPLEMVAIQAMWNEWSKPTLLTSPHADVQPGENMINTRLTLAFDLEYDDTDEAPFKTRVNEMYFGSEWPRQITYWCYHKDIALGVNNLFSRAFERIKSVTIHNVVSDENAITSYLPIRSAFKYAPEVSIVLNTTSEDDENPIFEENGRSMFEVDNYTLVNADVIGLLHNAAIQGEYNIPKIAVSANK